MSIYFLIFFTLVWSGLTLTFDRWTWGNTCKQFESANYASVTGRVTHSELKSHYSSDGGTTYSAEISYVYTVGTQVFTGDRLRFTTSAFNWSAAYWSAASGTVKAYPAGTAVMVYYNPPRPEEAVMFPGLEGADLLPILFLTPFNAVMVGLGIAIGGGLRERWMRPAAGGMKIITDGRFTRVRLPRGSAWYWGLGATIILAISAFFAVGLPAGMHPSISTTLLAIGVVYCAGLATYLWRRNRIGSGIDDLIIDDSSRLLELPLTFGRRTRVAVGFQDIAAIWVERIVHQDNDGRVTYSYAPTIEMRRTDVPSEKLADWSDQLKAHDFARWLGGRLGVPCNGESY